MCGPFGTRVRSFHLVQKVAGDIDYSKKTTLQVLSKSFLAAISNLKIRALPFANTPEQQFHSTEMTNNEKHQHKQNLQAQTLHLHLNKIKIFAMENKQLVAQQ